MQEDWIRTRHRVQHKVPHAIIVQRLQKSEVLGHHIINRAAIGVQCRGPEAISDVVDTDPNGNEEVVGRPRGVVRSGNQVRFEVCNLRDDIGCHAGVNNRVGHIGAIVGPIVSQNGRGIVLACHEADPLCRKSVSIYNA